MAKMVHFPLTHYLFPLPFPLCLLLPTLQLTAKPRRFPRTQIHSRFLQRHLPPAGHAEIRLRRHGSGGLD